MDRKAAQKEAQWALLTNGVTEAQVLAHGIRHLLVRAKRLIEESDAREHLYQVGGDLIETVPNRFDQLTTTLDKLAYMLSKVGESTLRNSLSIADRNEVMEILTSAKGFDAPKPPEAKSASRVAHRYLMRFHVQEG